MITCSISIRVHKNVFVLTFFFFIHISVLSRAGELHVVEQLATCRWDWSLKLGHKQACIKYKRSQINIKECIHWSAILSYSPQSRLPTTPAPYCFLKHWKCAACCLRPARLVSRFLLQTGILYITMNVIFIPCIVPQRRSSFHFPRIYLDDPLWHISEII